MKALFTILIILGSYVLNGQEKETFFKDHVNYLLKDGGVWKATNPDYKEDEQYSAKSYYYYYEKGIHVEHLRLKIVSDINDFGIYTSWDGYYLWDPRKEVIIYHSLGGDGSISNGVVSTPDSLTNSNVFSITNYEGNTAQHKDVTKIVSENEMYSEGFSKNASGEWEKGLSFTWKRVIKGGE